jgi:hypothetical protein
MASDTAHEWWQWHYSLPWHAPDHHRVCPPPSCKVAAGQAGTAPSRRTHGVGSSHRLAGGGYIPRGAPCTRAPPPSSSSSRHPSHAARHHAHAASFPPPATSHHPHRRSPDPHSLTPGPHLHPSPTRTRRTPCPPTTPRSRAREQRAACRPLYSAAAATRRAAIGRWDPPTTPPTPLFIHSPPPPASRFPLSFPINHTASGANHEGGISG